MYSTYNLFDDMLQLRNIFNNYFKDMPSRENRVVDFPYINLYDTGDTTIIKAVIPGVKPEEVNIELVDSSIIIEGERENDQEEKMYIRKERSFGKFKKSVKLPYPVDHKSIKAEIKDGILTVTLSKSEEAKPKKIEIR